MTSRERIDAAFRFEKVDRVPTSVFDAGVWISQQAGLSLQEIMDLEDGGAKLVKEYYDKLKSDIIYVGGGTFSVAVQAFGADVDFSRVGVSADTAIISNDPDFYKTIDHTTIREQLLKNPGVQSQIRQVRALKKLVGDEKHISTLTGAPFTNAAILFGVQDLMVSLMSEEDDLTPLFDFAVALTVEINNILLEEGADMVTLGDAVASGSLISQGVYDETVFSMTQKMIEQLKHPQHIVIHICGDVTSRLERLTELGIDGLSAEGLVLEEAMKIAYGHYVIMGILSPYNDMVCKTADEIENLSKHLCEIAGNHGGFILAPGCDLPNNTPLENVLAMTKGAQDQALKC